MNSVIITPFNPAVITESLCLSASYYGSFASAKPMSVFVPNAACVESTVDLFANNTSAASGSIVPLTSPLQQLVWLEHQQVDDSLKFATGSLGDDVDALLNSLSHHPGGKREQEIILDRPSNDSPEIFYRTPTSLLISVSPEKALTLDIYLPRFWRPNLLPREPVPYRSVPATSIDRVKKLLSTATFERKVADIVEDISLPQMVNDIHFLTGENDVNKGIRSRHSFADGSRTAAEWLKARFEDTGASCRFAYFSEGFAPNVICRYLSTRPTDATVILSAHYDSRGSFGSLRSPGANDDGSGVTALLGIARTIYGHGITFRQNVEFVAFAGEEQGLVGSRAYAHEMREADRDLLLVIQADMIGYRARGERPQLGLPSTIGTPEVAQLVSKFAGLYSPELLVGITPACCSDHQSFHDQGYPATQVFERAGPIADPEYHSSHDLSERVGYDIQQIKSIAKVLFATLLHAGDFDLPEN